jgi:hypothetical protein
MKELILRETKAAQSSIALKSFRRICCLIRYTPKRCDTNDVVSGENLEIIE